MQNRYLFLLLSFFVVDSVFSKQPSFVGEGPDKRYNVGAAVNRAARQQNTNSPNTTTVPMTRASSAKSFTTAAKPVMTPRAVNQKSAIGGTPVSAANAPKKPSRWARFKKFFSRKES